MKTWYKIAIITLMILSPFLFYVGEKAFCATPAEIQEWLDAHNKHRGLHGVPPVIWSNSLATSAQVWANTCTWDHSTRPYGIGENMSAAGYSRTPTDVVDGWYSEESLYDYNKPGFSMDTGHFTMVVWKNTTQIGCGYKTGCSEPYPNNSSTIWVCQYNNYFGQFSDNVLPPDPPDYAWTSMTSGTTVILDEVWGSSASDVFAVGRYGTILRYYGGSSWTVMNKVTNQDLFGVWGNSVSEVFAVGWDGTILRYNGSTWSSMASGTASWLEGVWGSSATNVFAVGYRGTILRYDGSSWSTMPNPMPDPKPSLYDVWGSSANDVFAVGYNGTILRYDGSSWSSMTSGTTSFLHKVWGASATDVFAVGSDGVILHYNGSSWSSMVSPTGNDLYGLWGTSGSNVFAVGRDGNIINYNGSFWRYMPTPTTKWLKDVWGTSSSNAFIVGFDGLIYAYGPLPPPLCPACSGVSVNLQNATFLSGTTCECIGNNSITIGPGVTVQSNATVTFKAPIVDVKPGFQGANGSTIYIKQQ